MLDLEHVLQTFRTYMHKANKAMLVLDELLKNGSSLDHSYIPSAEPEEAEFEMQHLTESPEVSHQESANRSSEVRIESQVEDPAPKTPSEEPPKEEVSRKV